MVYCIPYLGDGVVKSIRKKYVRVIMEGGVGLPIV